MQHRQLDAQDKKIEDHNKKLRLTSDDLTIAHLRGHDLNRYQKARAAFDRQVVVGRGLVGTGSGKIELVLP